jgi:hypothetical protein
MTDQTWHSRGGFAGSSLADDQISNESNLTDRVRFMSEETQIPMMTFGAKPFSDDSSCSSTSLTTSGGSRLRTMPHWQESNQASQTHDEGEHLVGAQRCHTCTSINDMLSDRKLIWT